MTASRQRTRVGLLGAGFIARVHLAALRRTRGVEVVALCDTHRERAERTARAHGVGSVHTSLDEMIAAGGLDAVHVLTPPATHRELAEGCLRAGLHTFVEKPLVLEPDAARELAALAAAESRLLGVNHNLLFHPGVLRLQRHVAAGRMGRLEHLALVHNVPLRQLATGDVGHFMFRTEANILWEQGVHLFAVVERLLGACHELSVQSAPGTLQTHGVRFRDRWLVDLACERGSAQVAMAFGRGMPEASVHAVGSDGAVTVDLLRNTWQWRRKTRYLDCIDNAWNGLANGAGLLASGLGEVPRYALSLFGLRGPDDPFSRSMGASIAAFHRAVRDGAASPCDGAHAAAVLDLCVRTAEAAGAARSEPERAPLPEPGPARSGEVVVLGGTGFIGRRCVQRLLDGGRPVTLLVRRPDLVPAPWRGFRVRVFTGDAGNPEALRGALQGADAVLHLATCAGDDPARAPEVMTAAVEAAAETARDLGIRRLVYASSTAALYLGAAGSVAGDAGPDPKPAARSAYSRAKIAAEKVLAGHGDRGPEVVVVRPAIVVGEGGVPEHSGVGFWIREVHCIGWGRGRHPLPFVLAGDCAAALLAALDAPAAVGRCYNLAGDVRLSAREWVGELRERRGRPYRFHPKWILWFWMQELGKWIVKLLAGRGGPMPSLRDLRSRSFRAPLDTEDAKRDLGWEPEADRERFLATALGREREAGTGHP